MKRVLIGLSGGVLLVLSILGGFFLPRSFDKINNEKVSSLFSFTRGEWEATLTQLPTSIRNRIYANPTQFFKLMKDLMAYDYQLFLHIDSQHPLHPPYYPPPHLTSLKNYPVKTNKEMQLQKIAAEGFMILAHSAQAHHIQLVGISAYRTYEYQENLYKQLKNSRGRAGASLSASPGHSQHHLGTALDFNSLSQDFDKTNEGRWLIANAYKYGWSLSYPKGYEKLTGYDYEPWHFRYITPVGCHLQREFFEDIQFYFTHFLHYNYHFYKEKEVHE